MKKIANIACAILIIIGAIIACSYASHEESTTYADPNGTFIQTETGEAYVHRFDLGSTQRRNEERKIKAAFFFFVYAIAIVAIRLFIALRIKTKAEIKRMESTTRSDFLS
ncbi:MAG: hypothetical protein PUB43_09140 [Oscillospiraceae bacterium]|nr:hypothetical protein [Oscillospiraceae bacterium]